nr:hypothetical protein [Geoalkalibacter ferrihydriticus]
MPNETNSNYSTVFSVWDRLHRNHCRLNIEGMHHPLRQPGRRQAKGAIPAAKLGYPAGVGVQAEKSENLCR